MIIKKKIEYYKQQIQNLEQDKNMNTKNLKKSLNELLILEEEEKNNELDISEFKKYIDEHITLLNNELDIFKKNEIDIEKSIKNFKNWKSLDITKYLKYKYSNEIKAYNVNIQEVGQNLNEQGYTGDDLNEIDKTDLLNIGIKNIKFRKLLVNH